MRQITVFHIDDGEKLMFPVDAQHAVGAHPFEWAKVPWTDDTRDAARKAKADAQANTDDRAKQNPVPVKPAETQPTDKDVKDGKADRGSTVSAKVAADNEKAVTDAKR